MAKTARVAMFLGGVATAGAAIVLASSTETARAAAGKGALILQSDNFAGDSSVPANTILQLRFNQPINAATVGPATMFVRGRNATATGYTKQVFGSYQVVGNIVRFYPRLPTHLRDATGKFYPEGSSQDDAAANAGFKPSDGYEVRVIGGNVATALRSTSGKALRTTKSMRFTTAAALPVEKLWTTQSYSDSPPPQFQFSNPPDTPPSASTQYATHGGAQDVPNSIVASLFCTKVPLAVGTVRDAGNVEMTMLARKGNYSLRRPVSGSVFIEQNFDTTLLAFQPRVALADLGTYGVRVTKAVKDLTEQNDFAPNYAREVLNQLYVFLSSARALSPGTPTSQLPDPSILLTPDWPSPQSAGGPAARGVLKTNLLALGDTYKDEIDPRMMLLFTTRDEPVTTDSIVVEFTRAENLYDATLSIGTVDLDIPSAAAAAFTASGGSAVLGDLQPTSNVTYAPNQTLYPNGVFNFRNISIPAGVQVTFTGSTLPNPPYTTGMNPPADTQNPPRQAPRSYPVTVKCLTFQLDGTISADGSAGVPGDTSNLAANYSSTVNLKNIPGGPGGPGGGNGGYVRAANSAATAGGTGDVGNDENLTPASTINGGRGGLGGLIGTGTGYSFSGGGGGGGQRTAGTNGTAGNYPSYSSWNGAGGQGGAAATGNTDLSVLTGGAGGGGGGNASGYTFQWGASTGTGGGGGGAVLIQAASTVNVGTTGIIRARGGAGGIGTRSQGPPQGGGSGGGAGGSVLMRSSRGFNLANPSAAVDVSGGAGGAGGGPYSSGYYGGNGGNGGNGFIKYEDPNGGLTLPQTLAGGVYSPSGGGVPSYVYTKWLDLGVQDPRPVQWASNSFVWTNQNDAIYIQAQMTRENPSLFGKPDTSAINKADQSSSNVAVMSQWTPIFLSDRTGIPGGAFTATLGVIPGLPANPPTEYSAFDVSPVVGKGYRFIRFRIFFQLDSTQTQTSAVPYVDRIVTRFEYNF